MKKFTLLFLILILINLGSYADGTEPFGDGTESNPYQVAILDNLLWISTNNFLPEGTHIIQTSDIDASETINWNDGAGFTPIGAYNSYTLGFVGTYDGMNHSISNLFINSDSYHVGLFAKISYSVIENLTLINTYVECNKSHIGALVGKSHSSSIINCGSENGIISGGSYVGGLVGSMRLDEELTGNSELMYCYATGSVVGSQRVGGLVAQVQHTLIDNCFVVMDDVMASNDVGGFLWSASACDIVECHSTAVVSANNSYAGGFAGSIGYYSTVNNCSSEGEVSGDDYLGGFSGGIGLDCVVINCYSSTDVFSTWGMSGGFLGNNSHAAIIRNCYSYGYVGLYSGGGFAGSVSDYIVLENNFWDIETSNQSNGLENGNQLGIRGKSHADMLNVATYTDTTTIGLSTSWDFLGDPFDDNLFEDVWNIDGVTNNGYPFFTDSILTVIQEQKPEIVLLKNNYPNPFSFFTNISFSIEKDSKVELIIYNFKGQKIKTLSDKQYLKGEHNVIWDGTDENSKTVFSGMYFYQLNVNSKTIAIKKCILIK